jgi:hypothetical protein
VDELNTLLDFKAKKKKKKKVPFHLYALLTTRSRLDQQERKGEFRGGNFNRAMTMPNNAHLSEFFLYL